MNNPINNLAAVIKNDDLKQFSGDAFSNLIKLVMFQDVGSGLDAAKNVQQLLFHLPNVIFWDKMERFLCGTFHDYEDQVRFTSRFSEDYTKYVEFVKRQIQLIDKIDEDKKIDYFAALTRSFLLGCITEDALYFKLAKFLTICTSEELDYLRNHPLVHKFNNSMMVSALYQYGLFTTENTNDSQDGLYIFSDFAKALKMNCLNFDEGLQGISRISRYSDMKPNQIAVILPNAENIAF